MKVTILSFTTLVLGYGIYKRFGFGGSKKLKSEWTDLIQNLNALIAKKTINNSVGFGFLTKFAEYIFFQNIE